MTARDMDRQRWRRQNSVLHTHRRGQTSLQPAVHPRSAAESHRLPPTGIWELGGREPHMGPTTDEIAREIVPSLFTHPVRLMWPRSKCFDYLYSEGQELLAAFPVQATISFYIESDSEDEDEEFDEEDELEEESAIVESVLEKKTEQGSPEL
uniref:protein ripply2-like isoform X2 n=1 Tax=Pristiophorus japonicus TaxID=55135 RepID=UPI00398EB315